MIKERVELIGMLGGKCTQCGIDDIEVLQLDHINNDGAEDILRFNKNLIKMFRHYLENLGEAKTRLQVLCANHNWKKRYAITKTKNKNLPKVRSGICDDGCGGRLAFYQIGDGWYGVCEYCELPYANQYNHRATKKGECQDCGYRDLFDPIQPICQSCHGNDIIIR